MKSSRLVLGLTLLNLLLLVMLLAQRTPLLSAAQPNLPVLRGRGLEIVDERGVVRASIKVHGPEAVNGRQYAGAVVLVMGGGDPLGAPAVKLAASDSGAGLGLSNGHRLADGRSSGVQLHAAGARVILIDDQGREQTLRP